MAESNNELLRTIKIAELPVKTNIDRDSVLLIQDNEDTKQMKVALFWDFVQQVTDNLTKSVNALMVEIETFLKAMEARDSIIQQNETQRQANETNRQVSEQERYESFEYIKRQWDQMVEFYNNTIEQEKQRVANELYRKTEWDSWVAIHSQWAKNESSRQEAEAKRVEEFNSIKQEWNILKADITSTKISLANRVTDKINECTATENTLTNNVNSKIAECSETQQQLTLNINNAIAECSTTQNRLTATVNAAIAECKSTQNTLTTSINNSIESCTNATNECIEVTTKLDSMFITGTTVPSNLDDGKVYLQYFT